MGIKGGRAGGGSKTGIPKWVALESGNMDQSLVNLSHTQLGCVPAVSSNRRHGCGCQNRFGIPIWLVGEFTTHFRTYVGVDWDVHWVHMGVGLRWVCMNSL